MTDITVPPFAPPTGPLAGITGLYLKDSQESVDKVQPASTPVSPGTEQASCVDR
jgi:hypothetical protein